VQRQAACILDGLPICRYVVDPLAPPHNLPPSADDDVSGRLKLARDNRGFTQIAVANRTKMVDPEKKGVSRTAIVGYEQGTSKPGLREIRLLCEVLKVSPNWLIFGTEDAAVATQASMELLPRGSDAALDGILRTAVVLLALKGHERDAIQSLALSLAGRQLGDMRLSALVFSSFAMRDAFRAALREYNVTPDMSLEEVAEKLSKGLHTTLGNRFKLDDEGGIINKENQLYPDPKPDEWENQTQD